LDPPEGNTVTVNCRRPGCPRPRACNRATQDSKPFCSLLCAVLHRELESVERICRSATNQPEAAELWSFAVDLSDRLSEFHTRRYQLTRDRP
jgi:hypothetical protein